MALASSAAAYVTSSGSGSGSAGVAHAEPVTITAGPAPSAELFPGTDGDVTVRISNPNPVAVHVGSLALDPSQGEGHSGFDASPSGCNLTAPALVFTTQTNAGLGWDVPAKVGDTNGSLDLDLAGSIHMSTDASSACQGAAFTVYLQAGP